MKELQWRENYKFMLQIAGIPLTNMILINYASLTRPPFLFADYEEMSRHFKNLYFKVCQIPFDDGQNDHQAAVVKFIRDCANDNNPRNKKGRTPLHIAAERGNQLTVLLILLYVKDKNPANINGMTPLHYAARPGHLEIVKLLLEHAEDKNPADINGWTPLYWAAKKGDLEIVKLLLEHSKDKNPAAKNGQTPLHWAAEYGHLEIVKLLLKHANVQTISTRLPST
jgi:ankyrin repeat protein